MDIHMNSQRSRQIVQGLHQSVPDESPVKRGKVDKRKVSISYRSMKEKNSSYLPIKSISYVSKNMIFT